MNKEYSSQELEKNIGYSFQDSELLRQALTHTSYRNEQKINQGQDYERLEFLGDAVLELVTSEFIFHRFQEMPEGKMTKMRATIVCEPSLAHCARDIELGQYIKLGRGEENCGGRDRDSIVSDVMEALIGAIFLDGGMEKAREYIHKFILSDIDNKQLFYDSKTILQEMVQKEFHTAVRYMLIDEKGPEHEKIFKVGAMIDKKVISTGVGKSKKNAEQEAAYKAVLELKKEKLCI